MFATIKRAVGTLFDLIILFTRGGVFAARRKGVTVGKNCRIYIRSFGSEPFLISMGDNVTITSGVKLITHDGSTGLVRNENGHRYQRYAPISIGDNVFVGVDTIVLPGITIGSNVVIGAGSVITKDVADNSVVAGNPARRLADFEAFRSAVESRCVNDEELEDAADYRDRVDRALRLAAQRRD